MNSRNEILLPGLDHQFAFLKRSYKQLPESILVIGSSCESISIRLSEKYNIVVNLIVEDYESLMNSKLLLEQKNIILKMMSFEATDFSDKSFDLIYAQASISSINRNKIVKEIKRILKPGGYFCVGEIVSLKKEIPQFMKDIYNSSGLFPLYTDDLIKYYSERDFLINEEKDFSYSLKEYYSININKLTHAKENLSEKEKSHYKKLLNKINHESNAYLNLGGDKYLGFKALLLKKGDT